MQTETTKKLTSKSDSDLDASNNRWETPPEVFAKLNEDFGPFDLDMTAAADNHLLPQWIGPGSSMGSDILAALDLINVDLDGLQLNATSGYSNPPYHFDFVNRLVPACAFAARKRGLASTLLLPLRTTSDWWAFLLRNQRNEVGAATIAFCDSRIFFYEGGQPRWNAKALAQGQYRADSAVFDSVILHFNGHPRDDGQTRFKLWEVPPHLPKIHKVTL